jgi:hypothetical protein
MCVIEQDDGSGGSGSRLGSGPRDKKSGSGGGNPSAAADMFKPPALTQELLALHNRDMERKMLSKFKEDRRTGEIRFVKDSPKHRLIVPQSGGTGGGDGAGVANRTAAVAVANMKRMLSAAMGGPDNPLILKGDTLHAGYGGVGGGVGGSGGNVGPAGDSLQLKQAGQQRRYQEQQQQGQQQHCRLVGGEAAVAAAHHHHHNQGAGVGGEGESGGGDGAHSPACLLRGGDRSQPPWSAYGSGGSGGPVPSGSGSGGGAAGPGGAGIGPGTSAYSVALLKASASSSVLSVAGSSVVNKHGGHEGHFGYNQSNMMQRGAPASMTGYSNLPGSTGTDCEDLHLH